MRVYRDRPPVLALEGPCLAGKTSLARDIAAALGARCNIVTIPCYVDLAGDLTLPPLDAFDAVSQHDAVRFFLDIEHTRSRILRLASNADLALIDRSVDTLLAHVYALDNLYNAGALTVARQIVNGTPWVIRPDLTLHLDVAPSAVQERLRTRPGFPELLVREDFNRHFNEYFATPDQCVARRVVRLDATLPLQELTSRATRQVISHGLLLAA